VKTEREKEIHQCIACEILLAKNSWENHHFPIPKGLGGTETVRLCIPCHDMVDRFNLENWPSEFTYKGWSTMTREARLLVMKAISAMYRLKAERDEAVERSKP